MITHPKQLFSKPALLLSLVIFAAVSPAVAQVDTGSLYVNELLLKDFALVKTISLTGDIPCSTDKSQSAESLFNIFETYNSAGNWACCESILRLLAAKSGSFSELQKIRFLLAHAEMLNDRQWYDSARVPAGQANDQAGTTYSNEKIAALLILSKGGLRTRNISSAYAWADSALQLSRKNGDKSSEGKALLQMGFCARRHFTAAGQRSFPYYAQAISVARAAGDSSTLFEADMYFATDNIELGRWSDATPALQEAVEGLSKMNNIHDVYNIYESVGYALEQKKFFKEALLLYKKGLDLSLKFDQPYSLQNSYSFVANVFEELNQSDSALRYANLCVAVQAVDPFYTNSALIKANIYRDMGDYKSATSMYMQAMDWTSEDFLYRNRDQLSGYEATLNTKEKELQVVQEKKRNGNLELIAGTVVFLLLLSGIGFMIQRRSQRKLFFKNALIEKQSIELERSLSEKEMLLKEIHHRVKNNLTVISSLMELQLSGIDNEKARAVINEGQQRIRSIALIHQRLYQHENLAAIDFAGFAADMIREVSVVFQKPGQKTETDVQVPETSLDIDTAVPLGLILNELLTNSFKYAFTDQKTGLIRIRLKMQATGNYLLQYSDNGPGLPAGFDLKKSRSLGLRLIYRLSSQLGGFAEYITGEEHTFIIHFKDSLTKNIES